LQAFLDAGKPVLGICRGMQLINVAFGGSLYQDIPSQLPESITHEGVDYDQHEHRVDIVDGGKLSLHLGGASSGSVVSIHHQAVKKLGNGLRVEARAAGDALIEAVSADKHRFVVGVQWHPEFHQPHREPLLDCDPLLDAFLTAAREAAD
jgi:putative glutamine amidotransferase